MLVYLAKVSLSLCFLSISLGPRRASFSLLISMILVNMVWYVTTENVVNVILCIGVIMLHCHFKISIDLE